MGLIPRNHESIDGLVCFAIPADRELTRSIPRTFCGSAVENRGSRRLRRRPRLLRTGTGRREAGKVGGSSLNVAFIARLVPRPPLAQEAVEVLFAHSPAAFATEVDAAQFACAEPAANGLFGHLKTMSNLLDR
jgi:hypothetical protein